jgi:hypothetical protein
MPGNVADGQQIATGTIEQHDASSIVSGGPQLGAGAAVGKSLAAGGAIVAGAGLTAPALSMGEIFQRRRNGLPQLKRRLIH